MPRPLDSSDLSSNSCSDSSALALIGIGCRFPGGAHGPARFWQLLCDGVDAISDVPSDRWNPDIYFDPQAGTPARSSAARGGFVDGIDQFDPEFFGISRREAASIDPQQRMLLETAWEALEDAGLKFEETKGNRWGVFVGLSNLEYSNLDSSPAGLFRMDTYSNTGAAMSLAANRISYCFDWHGPSFAVDTACSSALVAVHSACLSLWSGECTAALAGGVNALLRPHAWIGMSRLAMLSPDAQCKAFDASANGFVRSEGAGLVLIKPLADARRDGDRIYAVIRGTASNQDGHTAGITVPSEHAQAELVRAACRRAGIAPADVQYVEAHGTGTPIGDPIECRALGSVLRADPSQSEPLWIGSVKTNIGHLESAAGVAGLIKAALAIYHRRIPANLHFQTPNPDIPFDELRLKVPSASLPWPTNSGRAYAGVNSFGFGGTNAHVILSDSGPQPPRVSDDDHRQTTDDAGKSSSAPRLIPLSARTAEALQAIAKSYGDWLADANHHRLWDDFCFTAACRRTHHAHRLALVARTPEEARSALNEFADGRTPSNLISGRVSGDAEPRLVFVFSGQGTQFCGMVRDLLAHEPVFRDAMQHCDDLLREFADWSLIEELARNEATTRLDQTAIAQPAIFAVQVALARLWQTWGIEPSAVVGHSVGEVAAAYVCGILSLRDAVRIIYHRGRCMDVPEALGRMLAVGLPLNDVQRLLADRNGHISIAAINSPGTITLSGSQAAIQEVAAALEQRGVFHTLLKVQYAFHSPRIDGQRTDFLDSISGIEVRDGDLPFYSGVLGRLEAGSRLTPAYWWDSIRQTVQFATATTAVLKDGYSTFVELAAHGVLLGPILETADQQNVKVTMMHALRRNADERESLLKCAGLLFVNGFPLDWTVWSPSGQPLSLPTYPWQHERYWNETEQSQEFRVGRHYHRLLGHRQFAAAPRWENQLDLRVQRFLKDHCVQKHPVVPAAGFLEMAAAAARAVLNAATCVLDDVEILKACFLRDDQTISTQLTVNAAESSFRIHSQPLDGRQEWTEHVTGRFRNLPADAPSRPCELADLRRRMTAELSAAECYNRFHQLGLDYGPAFQCLERVFVGAGEALGSIRAPDALQPFLAGYVLQPALLDACLQVVICLAPESSETRIGSQSVYLPVEFRQVRIVGSMPHSAWAHARLIEQDGQGITADISVFDCEGRAVVEILGLRCRAVEGVSGQNPQNANNWVFEYRWQPQALSGQVATVSPFRPLAPSELAPIVREEFGRLFADVPTDSRLVELIVEMQPFCSEYILRALGELGLDLMPGTLFHAEDLVSTARILPRHQRLLERYLQILEDAGALRRLDDQWQVVRGPDSRVDEYWRAAWWRFSDSYPDFTLLHRIGRQLASVLRGEVDPPLLLFPEGNTSVAEWYYQDAPALRFTNIRLQRTIAALARAWPAGRPLRILEVGAGTGALTSFILPELRSCPGDVRYTFTDLSDAFLLKARERFQGFPYVAYSKLDLERDPQTQGYELRSFDVVVASQVLHATSDLEVTLRNLRRLLAPNGLLAFAEFVQKSSFLDIVFGVLEGWWRFQDVERRPDYPLMSLPNWRRLLADCGLEDIVECSGLPDEAVLNAVLLAREPNRSEVGTSATGLPDLPTSQSTSARGVGAWVLFTDRAGIGDEISSRLMAAGATIWTVRPGAVTRRTDGTTFELVPGDASGIRDILNAACSDDSRALKGVIHLWSAEASLRSDDSLDAVSASLAPGCLTLVQIVQSLVNDSSRSTARVWVVTQGAHSVCDDPPTPQPLQTSVWGLGRVAMNELRSLRPTMIDLGLNPTAADFDALHEELHRDEPEEELALRGGARFVHRLLHSSGRRLTPRQHSAREAPRKPYFRLETSHLGTFDQLVLRGQPTADLQPGQVEISVEASALNFSDVMKALGLYPGLPDGPVPLGLECAGRISRIGPHVEGWNEGEAVMAAAPFSFGSYAIADARYLGRIPPGMNFEQAATIPVAYLTAYYALHHLGHLRAGERVLIHAATGGVGLAAIQLAQRAQAEIFATAGTKEKREFLRWLGVPHVMDSRSLSFADEMLAATHGEGIDLVLNSLSGQAIQKSFSLLRDYGRFLEIGKRDIYGDSRLAMRPFRKNLSFHAIDLDGALRQRPELIGELFDELSRHIQHGELAAIPYRAFRLSTIGTAFRYMAQARHIGKVVISHAEANLPVLATSETRYPYRADGTYLITGGLGGLGLAIAAGMIRGGARRIVLMGRSGLTPETIPTVDALRAAGAEIIVEQADVTQPDQLAGVLARIAAAALPLKGILHLAMVLDDCLLTGLDASRLERVWSPKVVGAWNLHLQTRELPLDFFVCFSSISSLIGMEGQGNYAAANAFLDAFAAYRRALDLPALTINWGYLGEVGWVARHPEIGQRFEALGMQGIRPAEVMALMGRFLNDGSIQVGVVGTGGDQFVKRVTGRSPRFEALANDDADGTAGSRELSGGRARAALLAAEPGERRGVLESMLRDQVCRVLGTSPDRLDSECPLTDLGLDSLVAVELKNWTEGELGLNLPTVELLRGPSVSQLVDLLLGQLEPPAANDSANIQVEELSDAEVDALLETMVVSGTTAS